MLAREEERRRLRRDLHDGLGPALAGHLLRLDVISGGSAGSAVADDVASLRDDVQATVLDVRRVVEGLRPPAIDELGLGGALEQAGRRLTIGTGVCCGSPSGRWARCPRRSRSRRSASCPRR